MVKNTSGGSKHKSAASKHAAHTPSRDPTPSSPFERIASVEKILGNGMCTVITLEERPLTLICHIRGKFRGKHKSRNIVSAKSLLLVGLRDWESSLTHCDLLAVLHQGTDGSTNPSLSGQGTDGSPNPSLRGKGNHADIGHDSNVVFTYDESEPAV